MKKLNNKEINKNIKNMLSDFQFKEINKKLLEDIEIAFISILFNSNNFTDNPVVFRKPMLVKGINYDIEYNINKDEIIIWYKLKKKINKIILSSKQELITILNNKEILNENF